MVMELRVSAQDMIRHEEIRVSHVFHGLHELMNRSRIGTEFCLGKDRSDFHGVPPLVSACVWHYRHAR
jgi:hypothetical protein